MTNPLSTVYAGASPASSVSEAIELNKPTSAVPGNSAAADRFWSTLKRPADSDIQEVLEINFSTASLTNQINFDAVKFPHTITLEYTQDSSTNWQPVLDLVTGNPIVISILRSFPAILPSVSAVAGHAHPQHDYDGHWESVALDVRPTEIQKLRFVLRRLVNGVAPVDATGSTVPYSLALQNIYVGYQVSKESQLPRSILEDDSATTKKTFANTTDIFGSNLGFAKKTQYANNLLFNNDASAPLIWKSEPQPFPSAVVNFYADLRDRFGNPQTIDRVFIDPLYDGPHITLYYSNDAIGGDFVSSSKSLNVNQASFNNASISANNSLFLGNYGDLSFAQINNQYLSFDPSQDWWIGVEFTPSYLQDSSAHPIFSCDQFTVGVNQTGLYLNTSGADSVLVPLVLDNVNRVQLIAAYHNGQLRLSAQQNGTSLSQEVTATVALSPVLPAQLYIGTDVSNTQFLNSPISAFIIKQETWTDDSFLANPASYSLLSQFPSDGPGETNALVRFDPSIISATSATGFVGGPAFNYESLNWTPIPREYEMHRGNMKLPPTRAKFWNLEITNLHAEMSEKFVPVERMVKTFPPIVTTAYSIPAGDRSSPADLASNVQAALSNSMSFSDRPLYVGTGGNPTGISNTEVYVSDDYETSNRLRSLGNQWKYEQWRPDRQAPRFNFAGKHEYTIQAITQTTNVSFFAGLRQIQFSRTVNTSPQDQPFIEETFVDNQGINQGNWVVASNGSLYSGKGGSYARTTSVIIPTQRPVRAVQFAAQQTDAKEINTYGEFSDPNYDPSLVSNWNTNGGAKILGLTQPQAGSDTALLVSRQTNRGFWKDISVNYVTWGGISQGRGYQSGTESLTFPTSTSSFLLAHQGIQQTSILVTSMDGTITYVIGTDYTITATDGSKPDTQTTIGIVSTGAIPTGTTILVTYNWADATHPTGATYGDIAAGPIPPSTNGGIQSSPIPLPSGGKIHAAARVTATTSLSDPLWIQIIDSDTGGVLAEQQSNVGKNEVKEWYTSLDIRDFNGKIGATWGSLTGKTTWPSFNDNFTRANAATLGQMVSGQSWATPFGGTQLQVVTNAAQSILTGNRSEIDTGTPWGILDVSLGNSVTTGTHSSAVPVIDLGGLFVMNDSTVMSSDVSAVKFTLTTAVANGVKYRFKFMPSSMVPAPQLPSGTDVIASPYAIQVFTRSADGPSATETFVQTFCGTRGFASLRALMGATNQSFTYFNWTPTNVQVNVANMQLSMPVPQTSALADTGSGIYTWDQNSVRRWTYAGVYSYGTTFQNVTQSSLAPGGAFTVPGTMAVVDVKDQYGAMGLNVTQLASGLATSAQNIAFLNWNPVTNKIVTLRADGTIYDVTNSVVLKTSMFSSATAGPIDIRFVAAQRLSSGFKTTWGIGANDTQAIIVFQSNVIVGVYSGTGIWDTTVRGIGGANNGSSSGQYMIIEGFSWSPDASLLATDTNNVTWAGVSYNGTRTYGDMASTTKASVQNIAIRLVQKNPTLDYWFTQSVALFWDPVIWHFSCDGGITWWNAGDIRNNPNGVLLFPYNLTNYSNLMWRVTSHSQDVSVSNLTIRPWYNGLHQGIPPRPAQLPIGPNLVPLDHYGPISNDPKFMVWNKPVPRSWWFNFKKTNLS